MLPFILATLSGCVPTYANLDPLAPKDLWAPLPVQHVRVRDLDIAYVDSGPPSRAGDDGDPIILIHGLSSYMGFWEYQIPHLAERHRVLALDLPGYGASSRPDAPCTPPWYAGVVGDWMDTLGIGRATLMGHSMGGQIAMTYALAHPARVGRMILSAPAGFESFQLGAAAWTRSYWNESRALHATEAVVRANFTTLVFNRTDEGVERLIQERVRMGKTPEFGGTSVAVARSIVGMLDYPVRDRLGELTMPVLIVFGTDDHMIPNPIFNGGTTRSVAEAGMSRIPNATLVMVPGAGHTVHHDAPDTFNAAVDRFLP